jgi:hypothetical protein
MIGGRSSDAVEHCGGHLLVAENLGPFPAVPPGRVAHTPRRVFCTQEGRSRLRLRPSSGTQKIPWCNNVVFDTGKDASGSLAPWHTYTAAECWHVRCADCQTMGGVFRPRPHRFTEYPRPIGTNKANQANTDSHRSSTLSMRSMWGHVL